MLVIVVSLEVSFRFGVQLPGVLLSPSTPGERGEGGSKYKGRAPFWIIPRPSWIAGQLSALESVETFPHLGEHLQLLLFVLLVSFLSSVSLFSNISLLFLRKGRA